MTGIELLETNVPSSEEKEEGLRKVRLQIEEMLSERWFVNDDFTAMFLRSALVAVEAATCMELDQNCAVAHSLLKTLLTNGQDFSNHFEKGTVLREAIIRQATK